MGQPKKKVGLQNGFCVALQVLRLTGYLGSWAYQSLPSEINFTYLPCFTLKPRNAVPSPELKVPQIEFR